MPTLAQTIEASGILLGFLENFNCPGSFSEPDKIQIYRIQTHLLEEYSKAKSIRQTSIKD